MIYHQGCNWDVNWRGGGGAGCIYIIYNLINFKLINLKANLSGTTRTYEYKPLIQLNILATALLAVFCMHKLQHILISFFLYIFLHCKYFIMAYGVSTFTFNYSFKSYQLCISSYTVWLGQWSFAIEANCLCWNITKNNKTYSHTHMH